MYTDDEQSIRAVVPIVIADILFDAGYRTVASIKEAPIEELARIPFGMNSAIELKRVFGGKE